MALSHRPLEQRDRPGPVLLLELGVLLHGGCRECAGASEIVERASGNVFGFRQGIGLGHGLGVLTGASQTQGAANANG